MNDKFEWLKKLASVAAGALFFVACGGMDTDVPAVTPEDQEETAEQIGKADSPGDTAPVDQGETTGAEVDDTGEDEGGDEGDEPVYHRCIDICFKTLWCDDEEGDFETCYNSCVEAEETGIVSQEVLYCIEAADDCRDVVRCEGLIEPCWEVCGVYDQCGYFGDGAECIQWCAQEIWSSRLDWSSQGCVTAVGRAEQCSELSQCELSQPSY